MDSCFRLLRKETSHQVRVSKKHSVPVLLFELTQQSSVACVARTAKWAPPARVPNKFCRNFHCSFSRLFSVVNSFSKARGYCSRGLQCSFEHEEDVLSVRHTPENQRLLQNFASGPQPELLIRSIQSNESSTASTVYDLPGYTSDFTSINQLQSSLHSAPKLDEKIENGSSRVYSKPNHFVRSHCFTSYKKTEGRLEKPRPSECE